MSGSIRWRPEAVDTARHQLIDGIMKTEERRLALIRAAYEIIAQEGFEGLRTRDVAARVGVNIATLHYYFASKEALIEAVALDLAGRFAAAPLAGEPAGTALERLRQEISGIRARPEMAVVLQEMALRARRDPALDRVMAPLMADWRAGLEATIALGISRGEFWPELDAPAAATIIQTMLWGAGAAPLAPHEREHVYAAIERWLTVE
jgi:AcrR family transcriptional regulator